MILDELLFWCCVCGGMAFYFLPYLMGRNCKNALKILTINFLLGWTVVGWLYCISLSSKDRR